MRKTVYLVLLLFCGCGWVPAGKAAVEQRTFVTQESEMAETFTKWISLSGKLDAAASWSNGVPDGTKIAFFEPGSGVKPSGNPDFGGSTWKGLIVEPGFPYDIAQVGAPLHIKVKTIIQHRGSGTLHLKLTKFVLPEAQMVIDGDAVIDGVDSGSDYHVISVLVIGGRVRFIGNFKVFRNVQIRRFRLGAPRVSVRSSGTNGSMNDIEIGGGVVTFAEPFEFQPGDRVSVNGGLVDILHAHADNFWSLIEHKGWGQMVRTGSTGYSRNDLKF